MNCVICDKEIEESCYSHKVICGDKCFYIDFWNDKVKIKDDKQTVRIDGKHYHIGEENSKSSFRGFGGDKCIIKFFDGREIVSTNLWHNGEIPDDFKVLLPDNAEFVKERIIK